MKKLTASFIALLSLVTMAAADAIVDSPSRVAQSPSPSVPVTGSPVSARPLFLIVAIVIVAVAVIAVVLIKKRRV